MSVSDIEDTTCTAMMFDNIEDFLEDVKNAYGSEEQEKMLRGAANNVHAEFVFNAKINEYNGLRSVQLIIKNYKIIRRAGK